MKIYSTIITPSDIHQELLGIEGVYAEPIRRFNPRRGGFGYEVYLEGCGERHRRARNFGKDGKAATWDDYGVWMERLFALDPDAKIADYEGYGSFVEFTSKYRRKNRAPWLTEDVSIESGFVWPDAEQSTRDNALIRRAEKAKLLRVVANYRKLAEKFAAEARAI